MMNLTFLILFILPTFVFADALSLEQATRKANQDRLKSAQNFRERHVKSQREEGLAADLLSGGGGQEARAVSSEPEDSLSDLSTFESEDGDLEDIDLD